MRSQVKEVLSANATVNKLLESLPEEREEIEATALGIFMMPPPPSPAEYAVLLKRMFFLGMRVGAYHSKAVKKLFKNAETLPKEKGKPS